MDGENAVALLRGAVRLPSETRSAMAWLVEGKDTREDAPLH